MVASIICYRFNLNIFYCQIYTIGLNTSFTTCMKFSAVTDGIFIYIINFAGSLAFPNIISRHRRQFNEIGNTYEHDTGHGNRGGMTCTD